MAKTANSVSPRRTKSELTIPAAVATALASVTTQETIDISSVVVDVQLGSEPERTITEQMVHGDDKAILELAKDITPATINITILYTKGKDALGTDELDVHSLFWEIFNHTASALSIPYTWSPTGAVGDEEFSTDANETYVMKCPPPVGGTTNEKIKVVISLRTPNITKAIIT